jgi:hypothetical protein
LDLDPDAHLGALTIRNGDMTIESEPVFDERLNVPKYEMPSDWEPRAVFKPGDQVSISATGGGAIGPFETTLTAPETIDGVTEADLETFVEATRNLSRGDSAELTWASKDERGRPLSLFYGGSRLAFRKTVSYQAIEYFTLAVSLADDGRFQIPFDVVGQGIPPTAYRIYLRRANPRSLVFGSNRLALSLGELLTIRGPADGAQAPAERPPFQIIQPDPNVPKVVPGEPLEVRWSPLPQGTGPLEVRLNVRDPQSNEQHLRVCSVTDSEQGMMVIPGERTAILSAAAASTNQLSLYWRLMDQGMSEPDVGYFTHAISLLLDLQVE